MSYEFYNSRNRRTEIISTLREAIEIESECIAQGAVEYFVNKTEEDINKLDLEGYTPVAQAVKLGSLKIVKYLVDQYADVCKVGKNGKTPLRIAVENKNLQMIKFLLENGAEHTVQSAFLPAIETEKLEIVSMLKEKGALINYTYNNGHTPLTKAIEVQDPTVTKYLIDNGANVETIINDETNRYLMQCVKDKKLEMVEVLCEAGCSLDRPGECGYTPLTKATELDSFKIVQCLIQHGAKINTIDANKKTALAIAVSNCCFRIARYLIDTGSDIQLAKTEVEEFSSWNEDFASYLASLKLQPKSKETGHEEDTE